MSEHSEATIPALLLERYRRGELNAAEVADLRGRFGADRLGAAAEALAEDDVAILNAHPAQEMAAAIERRLHLARTADAAAAAPRGRPGWMWAAPVAVAAVLAVFALRVAPPSPDPVAGGGLGTVDGLGAEHGLGEVRVKGGESTGASALLVYRKEGDAVHALEDDAAVAAGDLLQIGVRLPDDAFVAVLSVDGRGTVTRHLPDAGDAPVALDGGKLSLVPHAYELDDAPAYERFFLVHGDRRFSVDALAEAVAAAGAREQPRLQPGLVVATLRLRKEAR